MCPGGRTLAVTASDILMVPVSMFSIAGRWTMNCFLAERKVLRSRFVLGVVDEVRCVSLGDTSSLCGLAWVIGILCWGLDKQERSVCALAGWLS